MIQFKNVRKVYQSRNVVLDDVSFEIKDGEFVSIVGKSGAGKTTLIRLLLGLEKPTSGEVLFDFKVVHKMKDNEIRDLRRKVGVVFQDYRLLAGKTVFENISYVMLVQDKSDKAIGKRVPKVLEATGLEDKSDCFPSELSGGEKQRVAVARAIVGQPDVIVADEPTGNLDPYNIYEVINILKKVNEDGKTVILASHDKEVINKLGKRVITLEGGRIIRDDKEGKFVL